MLRNSLLIVGLLIGIYESALGKSYNNVTIKNGTITITPQTSAQVLQSLSAAALQGYLNIYSFGQIGTTQAGTNFVPFTIGGITPSSDQAYALAVQQDGNYVIAGYTDLVAGGGQIRFAAARFLSDGRLDPTFGGQNGARAGTMYVPFQIAGAATNYALGVAVQADGCILLSGFVDSAGALPRYFALARLLPNGQLDTSFGLVNTAQAGSTYVSFSISNNLTQQNDSGYAVAIQSDGKIVVSGTSNDGTGTYFAIARFLQNGTLDTTFGQVNTPRAGTAYVPFSVTGRPAAGDNVVAVGLGQDGSIFIGGYSLKTDGVTNAMAVAKFLSNGVLDTTFGQTAPHAGTAYVPFNIVGAASGSSTSNAMVLQQDGSILLGGNAEDTTPLFTPHLLYFAVARFLPTGQLDPSFGQVVAGRAGTAYVPFSIQGAENSHDSARAMALQSDGSILLAGSTGVLGGFPNYEAVARFLSNGQLDNTFGRAGNGTVYIPFSISGAFTNISDSATGMVFLPNGTITLGGQTFANGSNYFSIAQFITEYTLQGLAATYPGQAGGFLF